MPTHNLPAQTTPFVGRTHELADIAALLADPACRLLTLVGPGGIGKTRLAIEAGRTMLDGNGVGAIRESPLQTPFPNGVYFVALQPLSSPDFIISTIASAVNFQFYPGGEPKQQLLDYFREKHLFLLLDNFEHLLDGVGLLEDILAQAPGVKLLATSRERLNLVQEWVFEVPGLAVPPSGDSGDIEAYSAVQLFVQNAHRVNTGFHLIPSQQPAVARICRMVGGMPLGLELASAWVRALSCEQIAGELERSLDILETPARNVPPRHRNMRAAFEPTWQRLSETEREVFKKLSVFRGGFTPEAALAVAGASLRTLSSLVDKSLLRVNTDGRYDLHELLRQYGEEQLNASEDESEHLHDLHCTYFAEFVQQQWEDMIGPRMSEALNAVEADLENVQAAWAWAASHVKREELWKFISGLQQLYYHHCRFQEAVIAFTQAADGMEAAGSSGENDDLFGCVLANVAFFCPYIGLSEKSEESYQRSLAILRQLDDLGARRETVEALTRLGWISRQTRPLEAKLLSQEGASIARTRGYVRELEWALIVLASIDVWVLEDYVEGKQVSEEALELARQFGHPAGMGLCCMFLGQVAYHEKHYSEAKRLQWESYHILQNIGDSYNMTNSLASMGDVALAEGDYREGKRVYQEALLIVANEIPHFRYKGRLLVSIAELLVVEGDLQRAAELGALGLDQPLSIMFETKNRATRLLQQLEVELPPDVFAAAVERGKARKLDETVDELLAELRQPDRESAKLDPQAIMQPLLDPLTERELEVLQLVASGLSNADIAERLVVEVTTVKKHLNHIYSKLGVETRTQALLRAQELSLL
jgi:predicted ATPase/DNA-binding CsgD family transcriptional regulator